MENDRKCPVCGDPVIGRIDKKFCSDQCRNEYNNKNNNYTTNQIRQVNGILRKNRRILMELNPDGKVTIHKSKLVARGFNFNYFTNTYRTRSGTIYYFCYEQGYLPIENDFFALVERTEA